MRLEDLYLWYVGDPATPRYVGNLKLVSAGKGVSLQYGEEWLKSGFPLSEDLRLIPIEFLPPGRLATDAPRAVGAVDDARPDRWGEKVIRCVDKPRRLSLMEYLYYAGDDRFGALSVSTSPNAYIPRDRNPLPRLADAQQLSEVAAKIEASEPINAVEARIIAGGGSPLGGAKPKALIEISKEQWVIKFFNNEPVDSPLIEHATMTLAKQAGITVAETQLIRLGGGVNAIAIRRFDREGDKRIHSISAGTAIRAATASGAEPEMGYPELARVFRRLGITQGGANQNDARELFRRMVFNILVDNTDDHEKNHSLMVVNPFDGKMRLAPAYDVLPKNSGQGYQEFICGSEGRESTLTNAMSQCTAFDLTPSEAAAEVAKIIDVVNTWKEHLTDVGVTDSDIANLAERLDGEELLSQRKNFDPSDYQSSRGGRTKKRSPFGRGL
ncbi:type II toxin-antitoxin system HipA family toxin [Lacisediminimonas sp.]|uniref:type II toxin-antitoxin system HipA family toxin n=1 Tax=Lacisediminimonas sp. TaxID=3060582 RepID=UPI002720DE89|nr:HipA domain-containing protein [Lacisediminimonas sp.]MDO8299847.1 HipA domain-containing protein [Lacisediminimonas sp.]